MGRILKAIISGFQERCKMAKTESARKQEGRSILVIVFERSGEIKLAKCNGPLARKNLTLYSKCPQAVLESVPPEILEFCKRVPPQYLCLVKSENNKTIWQLAPNPTEI